MIDPTKYELSEQELSALTALVSNPTDWPLIKKLFRYEIDFFWDIVRKTDPTDDKQVLSNHKLAVGVESSLGDLISKFEQIHKQRTTVEPEFFEDITKGTFS